MRQIDLEEKKKIQLEILDSIHSFCIHNEIKYSLGYGSLLGAVRHGGFIPWDDDIDIIMLRDDYTKFESLFPVAYADRFSFGTINRTERWSLPFGKVYDIRTIVFEQKATTQPIGVSVDVFPLDYVPKSGVVFKFYKLWFQFLCFCNRMKNFKDTPNTLFIKRVMAFVSKVLLAMISNTWIIKQIDIMSRNTSRQKGESVYYWPSYGNSKPIPVSWFNPVRLISFEGKDYYSVNNMDGYLILTYGSDYMTPPQEKDRVSYHTNTAFWKDEQEDS